MQHPSLAPHALALASGDEEATSPSPPSSGGSQAPRTGGLGATTRIHLWYLRARTRRIVGPLVRVGVLVAGTLLTVLGLLLVPLPGPGWAVVFLGLATLSLEFPPARRVLLFARAAVHGWTDWLRRQPVWVRVLTAVALAVFVVAVGWLAFRASGSLFS